MPHPHLPPDSGRTRSRACMAGLLLALCAGLSHASGAADTNVAPTGAQGLIERGRQLAVAADCAACHTAPKGGAPFAGGYAIESPLGAIHSTNITPSMTYGIGSYTLAQFSRALRQGVRADGAHLYPAMPYTAYTQISDEDTQALYTYFMEGVKPVDTPSFETKLPFPFSVRSSMAAWNALFLKDERFKPDAAKSIEVNRGAYLADALAHCGTCHTPRNGLMAERTDKAYLGGGNVGAWHAPNITSDATHGIGAWSEAELVQYMRTGHIDGKAQAAGPMAEAIEHSLQHLPEADLKAIALYLKQTPPVGGAASTAAAEPAPAPAMPDAKTRFNHGQASRSEIEMRGEANVQAGWRIYSGSCAHCHQANGTGTANGAYPSLFHNSATGADRADNLVATILHGVSRTAQGKPQFMPAFGDAASYTDRLSDQEIADVSNYVLTQYGNPAVQVSDAQVRVAREGGEKPWIVRLQPAVAPGLAIALAALVLLVLHATRRRRARTRAVH